MHLNPSLRPDMFFSPSAENRDIDFVKDSAFAVLT
jgi:hypothetical protein